MHARDNDRNKLISFETNALRTTAHRSMVQVFSGAGQPQIPPGLDEAGDQPQAFWGPHRQLHHGGKGTVWSCCLNLRPAAAAGALP